MSKFQEINVLRKEGKLDDAFHLATSSMEVNPDDLWLKRALGWVVYEYLNRSVSAKDFVLYLKWMRSFVDLRVDEEENMLWDSVLWSTRKLLAEVEAKDIFYDELLSLLRNMTFRQCGKAYSAVLSAALKLDGKWNNLHLFMEWWDLKNMGEEDFKEVRLDDGRKMMSLAERAVICYSKYLLRNGFSEQVDSFIPYLQDIVDSRKDLLYPPYYLAKLYLKKGDGESAFELLKKFAKSKPGDFWVWQLLSETQSEDEMKMSFLCRALMCRGKEDMLVALREQASSIFSKLGYCPEAKYEALKAIETRKSRGWSMTNGLRDLQVEKWFMQVESTRCNDLFYRQYMSKAETLIMGETRKYICLISYINEAKQMASFVTENRLRGFFRIPRGASVKRDVLVEITTNGIGVDCATSVSSVRVVEGKCDSRFFRAFEGYLQNRDTFGLVGKVFVDPQFLKGLAHGTKVKGLACVSFDKKKNKWGWRALSIEVVS